jgi:HAD superfamily phosphatase (TIGR01668 family)
MMSPWVQRVLRFLTRPSSRAIWFVLDDVTTLDAEALTASGIEGVLLDVDATLVPHHERRYPASVHALLERLQAAGLKVAIYSNARDIEALRPLGVPVIHGVPRKPDLAGFRAAVERLGVTDPARVLMIGDNPLSDGAAVDAGLRFAWCRPLPGREPLGHRAVRGLAERVAMGWRERARAAT